MRVSYGFQKFAHFFEDYERATLLSLAILEPASVHCFRTGGDECRIDQFDEYYWPWYTYGCSEDNLQGISRGEFFGGASCNELMRTRGSEMSRLCK